MKNFKRKSIYLAVAASIGVSNLAIATNGGGMHINSDGTGQVLLYPYYTTRGGIDTYMSLINTTSFAKAVKVRFIESLNSREVLDFNLYLSPYDMWTAAVVNTATGAKVVTADKSCTTPAIPAGGQPFVNYAYVGTVDNEDKVSDDPAADGINIGGVDGESTSLDRTREGYIEVIEMGEILDTQVGDSNYDYTHEIIAGLTHVDGVPHDCTVLTKLKDYNLGTKFAISAPGGGLTGSASLIAPASGTDFSYDPVAIDNFASQNIWHEPGTIEPDLRHGQSNSDIFYHHTVVNSSWGNNTVSYADLSGHAKYDSVEAVNALLMHNSIINEFVLDNVTLSGTDWVVTMPTKRYSVPVKDKANSSHKDRKALPPFTSTFYANGACEPVNIEYYDREENTEEAGFSPPTPINNSLCWEANVVTFNESNILNSAHSVNINVAEGYQNGWVRMHFDDPKHNMVSDQNAHTYYGLPVIGFMVQDFVNLNAAPGVMATYGGNFKHKTETCVSNTSQPGVPNCEFTQ